MIQLSKQAKSGKKQLILCVLEAIKNIGRKDAPVTQTDIADVLLVGFPCDRKTVGRNIKVLQEMGYPIVKTTKGYYMERMFSDAERNYVIACVRRDSVVPLEKKTKLLDKLKQVLDQ